MNWVSGTEHAAYTALRLIVLKFRSIADGDPAKDAAYTSRLVETASDPEASAHALNALAQLVLALLDRLGQVTDVPLREGLADLVDQVFAIFKDVQEGRDSGWLG